MHVRRGPTLRPPTRGGASTRRLVTVAVVATGLVLALGVSGAADLDSVRGASAAVLGPLERVLGPGEDAVTRARADQAELAARLAAAEREAAASPDVRAIVHDPALVGARVVIARVVGVGASGPAGPERMTIDVGSRDGVTVDRTVVAAEGLVGRVVAVAPWTADVLVVGSADLSVGVRVGAAGVLGEVSGGAAPGATRPPAGMLSFSLVERGVATTGDAVTTLGSVGGRPFVPGIPVGTVTTVDGGAGRLAPTGTLTPAVDTTSLDVVGVVISPPRTRPRPVVVTGTG